MCFWSTKSVLLDKIISEVKMSWAECVPGTGNWKANATGSNFSEAKLEKHYSGGMKDTTWTMCKLLVSRWSIQSWLEGWSICNISWKYIVSCIYPASIKTIPLHSWWRLSLPTFLFDRISAYFEEEFSFSPSFQAEARLPYRHLTITRKIQDIDVQTRLI